MKKMTSAYANKLLRQLNEDKEYFLSKEDASATYVVAVGEEPIIPEYDYRETADILAAIDKKVQIIKHAINTANLTSTITVGEEELSIDVVLIRLAQLNRRKMTLDYMRKHLPRERYRMGRYESMRQSHSNTPEYECINYDLDLVKAEFEKISDEIMQMQIALDRHNQTFEFEVDI
ncbi:MAG: hypothetical protein K6G01_02090 [Eubacterium sp.]|nr:hypothetical protein [Eubacterium sp.]